jgi:hypothetical protein
MKSKRHQPKGAQHMNLVARIRGLLDRLVACERLGSDEREIAHNEVAAEARGLPREGILETLDQAIGTSKRRRQEAVYILSELMDVPEAVQRVGVWLKDPDPQWRSWLIQVVAHNGLREHTHLLNDIIEHDPDPFCRDQAIYAAGVLREGENLPTLLRLAEQNDKELIWRLAFTLTNYATEECRPHLQRWFEDETLDKSARVISAWGMGKLGDRRAIEYLIQMLDDPDRQGPNFFEPGESIRAAQALCDIHNWRFKWHKSYVAKTLAKVKEAVLTNQ